MTLSRVDRRYLAGLRFIDAATGGFIERPLILYSTSVRWVRSVSGIYAILAADGLETHDESFAAPPPAPPVGSLSFRLEVWDPQGIYVPRAVSIVLPRSPVPDDDDSVLTPVAVPMFQSPRAGLQPYWAVIRGRVEPSADNDVPHVFVRVVRESDGSTLGEGMTATLDADRAAPLLAKLPPAQRTLALRKLPSAWARGQFCVSVVGLSVRGWTDGSESSFTSEVAVRLHLYPEGVGSLPIPPVGIDTPALPANQSNTFNVAPGRRVDAGSFVTVV